tara:strand:+ start:782 stop:2716 length:1935 start_codon:yes stop_codon:yes gene_type:complete
MCGIVGVSINNESKNFSQNEKNFISNNFNNAIEAIKHRGPDGSGSMILESKGIFLGHTRLSIIDLSSAGTQPMYSNDGNITIIFNGEIYNYIHLKEILEDLGYKFLSSSDTEVLIYLYIEYGLECFELLDGIFSIAIYDKKNDELILCRDGMGVKPLYYFNEDDLFVFSSEIKSIEKLVSKKRLSLSKDDINRYLTFQWCPGDGTTYREIKKLNPGEIYIIKKGLIDSKKTFYELPIIRGINKENNYKRNVFDDLDEILRKSIHDQMISDAPLGAFLSGGLDSTCIVNYARENNPDILCFTIDSKDSSNDGLEDDLPYAKSASKHLGVPLEIIKVSSDSLVQNLEQMIWMLDEPLGDPAPLNVLYISQLAKENGIKVLLSGAGGDDVFSGYRRHYANSIDKVFDYIPSELTKVFGSISSKLDNRIAFFRRLKKLLNGAHLKGNERIINYFKWIDQDRLYSLYSDEFKRDLCLERAEQPMINFLNNSIHSSSDLERMLGLEQRFFTTDHNLLYTDKMSMAAGVEVRVPLLSKDLIEFAYKLPDKYKQNGKVGKWILKKVMEQYLPKSIIYRPKTGFGVPLRRWLQNELKEFMEDLLSERAIKSRGVFNFQNIKKLREEDLNGKIDASYTIFSLMCLEIWFRQHLD